MVKDSKNDSLCGHSFIIFNSLLHILCLFLFVCLGKKSSITYVFSCLQDVVSDGCLKSVNLFPDKVLRGAIIMMTLRFDMMSKMYKGKSGPCLGEMLVIQIDPKVMMV